MRHFLKVVGGQDFFQITDYYLYIFLLLFFTESLFSRYFIIGMGIFVDFESI